MNQYIPLERFVLKRAGIDPDTCNGSLDEVKQKDTEEFIKAKRYLEELSGKYYKGNDDDERIISGDDFGLLIHREYAKIWQPESDDIPTSKEKTSNPKPAPSELNMLGLFLEEMTTEGEVKITDSQGNMIPASDITQTDIVNNIHRLATKHNQTLKGLSDKTLKRGIKKALDSLDKHYDEPSELTSSHQKKRNLR